MDQKFPSKMFKAIIAATFPDNRKREVFVTAKETIELNGLNWSGGTRFQYRACGIDGKPMPNDVELSLHHPMNNPYEGRKVTIPLDTVIVRGGHFCGKEMRLTIHCNPANMPKLITNKGV